jgi:hypothetical protein
MCLCYALYRQMVGIINEKLERFFAGIDSDIKAEVPTNMLKRAQTLTSDVIVTIAFGEDWGG